MSTSSTSSIFSGASRYSSDFQQIIDRSVAIASLPLTQIQSQKTALSGQSAALASLDAKFASLQSAISSLGSATLSYSTSVSDGTVAQASVATSAFAGAYEVQIVDLGSYTSAMSSDSTPSVTDPSIESISTASSLILTVDGTEYQIEPSAGTLTELAQAINASDAPVEATIINIGPSSAPDYRLSIQSTKLGNVSIQLNDGTDLLDTLSTGTLASYRVNGQPAIAIESDSRSVTISPGLTVTMLKAGITKITVSHNTGAVSSAMSSLASAYNAAAEEIDKHRGKDAGALRGSSMLHTLGQTLRDIAGYEPESGAIASLTSLGLNFDDKGRLSLDMTAFSTATEGQFEALSEFLGSTTTTGFLKYSNDLMNGLEDSSGGVIKTAVSFLQTQMTQQDQRISDEQDRIDRLHEHLISRMAEADALIASLETQVRYMTGLFSAMQDARHNN